MAVSNDEALTSGVLRGIEIAVAGGLITPDQVRGTDPTLTQMVVASHALADQVVAEADEDAMPSWRQVLTGEIVGISVSARLAGHNPEELTVEEMRDLMMEIFGRIDNWHDLPPA